MRFAPVGLSICGVLIAVSAWPQFSQDQLSNVWSRVEREILVPKEVAKTGLAGSDASINRLEFISKFGTRLGLKVATHPSFVTVPVTGSIEIELNGRTIRAAAIYPNLTATNSCTIQGIANWFDPSLVLRTALGGEVAVMPFDCGTKWTKAFEYGAKAVLFVAPKTIGRLEAEAKLLSVPCHLPRFLIEADAAIVPLGGPMPVRISCRQNWQRRQTKRVHIIVPGTDNSLTSERIVLFSAVDGMSIAPEWGTSSEHSISSAANLNLLSYFARHPPRRSIEFVFADGHHLGLKAERQYVEELLETAPDSKLAVFILDISSRSPRIGTFSRGSFYEFRPEATDASRKSASALRVQVDFMAKSWRQESGNKLCLDGINESDGKPFGSLAGVRLAIGAEPFVLAGLNAITFATIDDARTDTESPWEIERSESEKDLLKKNVLLQTKTIAGILEFAANQPTSPDDPKIPNSGIDFRAPQRSSLVAGFGVIDGKVVRSEPEKSIFPTTPATNSVVSVRRMHRSLAGVRGAIVEIADPSGKYFLEGIPTVSSYWHSNQPTTNLRAHQFDPISGRIVAASGEFASIGVSYSTSLQMTTAIRSTPLVLFDCESSTAFNLNDPLSLERLTDLRVIGKTSFAPPNGLQITLPVQLNEPAAASIFYPKGTDWSLLLLRNGDVRGIDDLPNPGGDSSYRRARNLNERSKQLAAPLRPFRLVDQSFETWMGRARDAESHSEADYETNARTAWSLALRVYAQARGIGSDSTLGLLLYVALAAPFAFIVERFAFGRRQLLQRIIATAVVFTIVAYALRMLHPAFLIVQSPIVIFVGFIMAGLSLFVMAYLFGKFDETIIGDSGKPVAGFGVEIALALSGMRRRPLRSGMTMLLVTVVTVCLMAFSSIKPALVTSSVMSESMNLFSSIHRPGFLPFMLDKSPSAEMQPVLWHFAGDDPAPGSFSIRYGGKQIEVRALVSFGFEGSPAIKEEIDIGRFIELPEAKANELGIKMDGLVTVLGRNLAVRNIYKGNRRFVSKESVPVDFPLSGVNPFQPSSPDMERNWLRFSESEIAIVDETTIRELGGLPRLYLGKLTEAQAMDLSASADLILESNGQRWSTQPRLVGTGVGLIGIALVVGAFFVMNTLAASAQERKSEIKTLSSLGMAPNRVAGIFLAESIMYGIVGAVLGFIFIQGTARIIGNQPGLELNCSSTSAILSTLLVMGACIGGAIYPARLAVRSSTSSRQEMGLDAPTEGDTWQINLPFTVNGMERTAMISNLASWFQFKNSPASDQIVASHVRFSEHEVSAQVSLAPFDLAVSQLIQIGFVPTRLEDVFSMRLQVERKSGERQNWVQANRNFVAELRQLVLDWQTAESQKSIQEP
jgi:ABC-type multidrug transport system permease subunit